MTEYIAVFAGGGLGSLCRYGIYRWFFPLNFGLPWHTFAANFLACLILGYLLTAQPIQSSSSNVKLFLTTGFCGGFSTFSTFSFEAIDLFQQNKAESALLYIALSLLFGGIGLLFGFWIGKQL